MNADISQPGTTTGTLGHPPPRSRSWLRGAGWLTSAALVLSASNYLFSLAMARILPADDFVIFVGAQSVLLVIGTGVMSAVPWVVSREVSRYEADDGEAPFTPGQMLYFALTASAVQGVLVAVAAALVCLRFGSTPVVVVAAVAAFAFSMVAAPVGYLQGSGRFAAIGVLRIGEGTARIGLGLLVVHSVSGSAWGAIAGMPVGSALLVGGGLVLCRSARPITRLRLPVMIGLLKGAAVLGATQLLLTAVASLDTVIAAAADFSTVGGYAYQTAGLLGRAPLFVALALAQALYPALVRLRDHRERSCELRRAVDLYVRLGVLVVLGSATVPASVIGLVAGESSPATVELLRFTAISGVLVGLLVIFCVARQADGRRTSTIAMLAAGVVVQVVLLQVVATVADPRSFAVTSLAITAALAAVVLSLSNQHWPFVADPRGCIVMVVVAVVVAVPLRLVDGPLAWTSGFIVGGVAASLIGHAGRSARLRRDQP